MENPPESKIKKTEPKKEEKEKKDFIKDIKNIFKKKEKVRIKEQALFKVEPNKEIIELPELTNEAAFDIKYPLIKPYAYAHIKWDPEQKELIYFIEEPLLIGEEQKIFNQLEEGIKELINISFINLKDSEIVIEYLEKNVKVLLNELGYKLTKESFLKIMYYIYRNFVGMNEIEPLLNDYHIEDIECNGSKVPVYIVHRKYRNLRTNLIFPNNEILANLVEKIAQKCGGYISYANPILDGVLPDGSIDYEEPIIYKENKVVKISKIGKFIDKFYKDNESNKPIPIKNIEVPAFDKKTLKISWNKVDYVYRHKINEDLFEIKSEFGRKIRLTGCHSIFSLTKEGIKSERTDKMKIGDHIAIPLTIPENDVVKEINIAKELSKTNHANKLLIDNIPDLLYDTKKQEIMKYLNKIYKRPHQTYYEHKNKRILPLKLHWLLKEEDLRKCKIRPTSAISIPTFVKIDKEFVRLLGLYAAEGWLYDTSNVYALYFSLNKKETNLIETIKTSAKKCFDLKVYIEPEEKNAIKVKINSYALWILFNEILKVTKGAKEKRIPNIIFNISKELQQEFLRYWSLGDYGSTASKNLANDISYLSLFNKDIVSFYSREKEALFDQVRKVKSYEHYTNFFVRDINNPYSHMVPTQIFNPLKETHNGLKHNDRINKERLKSIINDKRYKRFIDLKNTNSIKFIKEWTKRGFIKNKELTKKGKELIQELEIANKLINSDLGFAKIKTISRIKPKKEFVYDLSIKGHENFVGGLGGICCHNSRVNATYTKDITTKGPTFSIRKFTKEPWTPIKLIDFGTVSPEILAYLWLLVEYGFNLMIIGGTGSGKTSFLNSLAFFIPPKARIITIEDTREINIMHNNWLPAVARAGVGLVNIMGQKHGEVTLFDLLKESFRQRPDYVIVGEIRGKEAFVMFQGAASGHPTASTMHAESVETMIRRLQTNPINLAPSLVESLDVVCVMVQTKVKNQPVRRLNEISEIIKVSESGRASTNIPFVRDPTKDVFYSKKESHVFNKLSKRVGIPVEKLFQEFNIRAKILMTMYQKKIFGFKKVQEMINEYYVNPRNLMKKLGLIK